MTRHSPELGLTALRQLTEVTITDRTTARMLLGKLPSKDRAPATLMLKGLSVFDLERVAVAVLKEADPYEWAQVYKALDDVWGLICEAKYTV